MPAGPSLGLFFSHAHADAALAKAVSRLLEVGAGIPSSEIFLSSEPETGVAVAEHFSERLRKEVLKASAFIALVTYAYRDSRHCMYELGAAWGASKKCYFLLTPPFKIQDMPSMAMPVQSCNLEKGEQLDATRDSLLRALSMKGASTSRWNQEKGSFLALLPEFYRTNSPQRRNGEDFLYNHLGRLAQGISEWILRKVPNDDTDLWLVVVDVDRQKQINVKHGTDVGDEVLLRIEALLASLSGTLLHSGRCGDDTFFCLLSGSWVEAKNHADTILGEIAAIPKKMPAKDLWLTASAGMAKYLRDQDTELWLFRAHNGCVQARLEGGGKAVVGMDKPPRERWS